MTRYLRAGRPWNAYRARRA